MTRYPYAERSALSAICDGLVEAGKFFGDLRPIAEKVVVALGRCNYEIIERSALEAMREAVESRAAMAAIGIMLEGAKPGDLIDGWPPNLSPPTGWRKESYVEEKQRCTAGEGAGVAEHVHRSRIVKER